MDMIAEFPKLAGGCLVAASIALVFSVPWRSARGPPEREIIVLEFESILAHVDPLANKLGKASEATE